MATKTPRKLLPNQQPILDAPDSEDIAAKLPCLVTVCIETDFRQSQEAFFTRPSADNWVRLTTAMYAFQAWRQCISEKDKLDTIAKLGLATVPVLRWPSVIAKATLEDFNS